MAASPHPSRVRHTPAPAPAFTVWPEAEADIVQAYVWYEASTRAAYEMLAGEPPMICHGQACVRGTRVLASVILDNLAAGVKSEEIAASYPGITDDDVRAVLAYAADLASERVLALPA